MSCYSLNARQDITLQMSNPFRQWIKFPWISLFFVAILTLFWVFFLEFFLWVGSLQMPFIQDALSAIKDPPLSWIASFAIAAAFGSLAVFFLSVLYPQHALNPSTLVGLFLCLLVVIFGRAVLTLPSPWRLDWLIVPIKLLEIGRSQLFGLLFGIFGSARFYR